MRNMLIRKKSLKIQERLGMRIGIAYGTSKTPVLRSVREALEALREVYNSGFKTFLLPKDLFSRVSSPSDLYKEYYGDLLSIKNLAKKYNIELALHNPSLPEDPLKLDSELKIFSSVASVMDCRMFIIRPTFYPRMPHDQATKLVIYKVNEIMSATRSQARLGIETTGRVNELGSLEDVIDISRRTTGTEPILNWAHIHARGAGTLRTEQDFRNILDKVRSSVGQNWLGNAYFIFSASSYGPSGEIKQIPLSESDLNLSYLIKQIMSLGIKGSLVFDDPGREKAILNILTELGDMVR